MTDKLKNIISNLIGLGVIALGTVKYLENDDVINFVSLLVAGFTFFLFKVSETKNWINRFLSSKIESDCSYPSGVGTKALRGTIGDAPDPNKEEK